MFTYEVGFDAFYKERLFLEFFPLSQEQTLPTILVFKLSLREDFRLSKQSKLSWFLNNLLKT
jgi:hypothetical protein